MATDRAQVIEEGEEAMTVQRGGLGRIFKIGHAFELLQLEAMERSHSQNPVGRRYNEAYAALAKPAPELTKVNKTDRAQYIWCYQFNETIAAWWETVAQNQRDRWSHPDTIKRHYLAAHGGDKEPKPVDPNAPVKETLREANMRLQDEVDTLKRQGQANDNVSEGRDWTWQDSAKDIAAAWFRLYPTKAVQVAAELMRLSRSTTTKPRRQSQPKAERAWDRSHE
jgi:hypothetical protein